MCKWLSQQSILIGLLTLSGECKSKIKFNDFQGLFFTIFESDNFRRPFHVKSKYDFHMLWAQLD